MLRTFLPLALAATLFAPLAAFAEDAPAVPATPAAPTAPAQAKPHNHLGGKITAVDADKKTVTVTHHKKDTTLTLTSDAKIYKADDAKGTPTGTFADLTVGTMINARITGDESAPTATEIHVRAPKADKNPNAPTTPPAATPAPAAP